MDKKLLGVLAFAVVVGAAVSASAAPVDRLPASEEAVEGAASVGARADFILDRDDEDSDEYAMNTYEAQVGYQFNDRARAYLTAGVAKIEYDGFPVESDNDPIFGIGATFRLFETESDVALDLDAKYRYLSTEFTSSSFPGIVIDTDIDEWQAALTVSKTFVYSSDFLGDSATPYVGVKYNDFNAEGSFAGIGLGDYGADKVVGVYTGVDFAFNKSATLGLQGRFIDETAVMVDLNFRF